MDELKPCSLDAAQKWVEQEISDYCTDGMLINSEIEAVSALKRIKIELARRAEPENKPLTLEELEQRDGKPVWVEGKTSLGVPGNYWTLLMVKGTSKPAALNVKGAYNLSNYGKTWIAYAREPVNK